MCNSCRSGQLLFNTLLRDTKVRQIINSSNTSHSITTELILHSKIMRFCKLSQKNYNPDVGEKHGGNEQGWTWMRYFTGRVSFFSNLLYLSKSEVNSFASILFFSIICGFLSLIFYYPIRTFALILFPKKTLRAKCT